MEAGLFDATKKLSARAQQKLDELWTSLADRRGQLAKQTSAAREKPKIAAGAATRSDVDACFARTHELLGRTLEVLYCPHADGPPRCWCRMPLPGLGVVLIRRHGLDPSRSLFVGHGPGGPAFARRLGFGYRDAAEFFSRSGT